MALHGSTVPTDHGEFVVTYVCPNRGSWEALKIAADRITPSAYEPGIPEQTAKLMQRDGIVPHHATEAPMPPHLAERLDGKDDDEGTPYDVSRDPDYRAGGSE